MTGSSSTSSTSPATCSIVTRAFCSASNLSSWAIGRRLVGEVRPLCLAQRASVHAHLILYLASPACPLTLAHTTAIESVVAFIIYFVLHGWQPIADFSHGIIKVVLYGGAQRNDIRLVFEEDLSQLQLALEVILDMVKPVFFILFVEGL